MGLVAAVPCAKIGEEMLESGRKGDGKFHPGLGDRVGEAQGRGVKREAVEVAYKTAKLGVLEGPCDATAPVGLIPHDGEPEVSEVNADLMSPARLEARLEVREALEGLDHGKVRDGGPPLPDGADGHSKAVPRVASDRGFDHPLPVRKTIMNKSKIASLDAPRLQLG